MAGAFVREMEAFFGCSHDTSPADGIPAYQLHVLRQHFAGERAEKITFAE
jgi:hypothetical protein